MLNVRVKGQTEKDVFECIKETFSSCIKKERGMLFARTDVAFEKLSGGIKKEREVFIYT